MLVGAGNQKRTDDLVITNDVLYRLSHTSICDSYIISNIKGFVNPFLQISKKRFIIITSNNNKKLPQFCKSFLCNYFNELQRNKAQLALSVPKWISETLPPSSFTLT